MKQDKRVCENNEEIPNNDNELNNGNDDMDLKSDEVPKESKDEGKNDAELEAVKAKLEMKEKQCDEYFGLLQRTVAEFDNYKKRTVREKEALYSDAVSDVISTLLPVVDNFERAVTASGNGDENSSSLREGIELVYKQLKDVVRNLGIEEIKCVGENFDPQLHNAVMHIDDESYGENVIVEEFQKGYMLKDKVIRHSMVKVAN